MGGLAAVGGLAAPFSQTHQKKTVHPNFGWKPVMFKNWKSGGTCCVGGLAAVGGLTAVGGLAHFTCNFSILGGLAAGGTCCASLGGGTCCDLTIST